MDDLFAIDAIGDRLRTQDNQCTADPVFVVQTRRRLYGVDPQYAVSDVDIAWTDGECEASGDERAELEAEYQKSRKEPEGWHRTGFLDIWDFVAACFTDAAAKAFIESNRHRMRDPRVFVDSAYRNFEWQAIAAHLAERSRR